MSYAQSKLFTPITLGNVTFKNRIVMAPMTRQACPEYRHTELAPPYYARRAAGGAGLIISEAAPIGHKAANAYENCALFSGESLESWKLIVDAVHEAGGKFWPQLWHSGGVRELGTMPDPDVPPFSPSGFLDPAKRDGHAMTKQDIRDVIKAFVDAAKAAKDMGCDGVEIHGCHGYLIDEFLWTVTNERTDEYGAQTIENRTRFAVEIIEAVRDAVGEGFPIGFRFSQWKHQSFDVKLAKNPDELKELLAPIAKAGVDLFHCSTRRYWEPEFEGSPLNLAAWVKKVTGVPAMTVGSVGLDAAFVSDDSTSLESMDDLTDLASPASVDGLIKSVDLGEFDMVAVGRAILADPDWPTKLREGRSGDHIAFSKAMLMELK